MAEQVWRPRPCVTRTGGPGRPGFPSALTTKGRLRKKAAAVRMKGGESRPGHGDESLRFGPDEPVPGWKTPQWSAGRRRARKARGTFTKVPDQDVAPNGAPLPHIVREKGKRRRWPRAALPKGPMNHVCADESCLKIESEIKRTL